MSSEGKKKILVADDTKFFCGVIADLLTSAGYEVTKAFDGLDALRQTRDLLPELDLLILDVLMPKMTGFDVLREIRKDPNGETLTVMAITGVFKQSSEIDTLKKLGTCDYITKNTASEEILQKVKLALGETDENED